MLFGRQFRKFRRQNAWSLERLAKAMDVTTSYLSGVERGVSPPLSPQRIHAACELLQKPRFAAHYQRLAQWDRMMRVLPAEAYHGRAVMEAIGLAFADGKMTERAWKRIEAALKKEE